MQKSPCPICKSRFNITALTHKASYCRFKTTDIACNYCGGEHKVTNCPMLSRVTEPRSSPYCGSVRNSAVHCDKCGRSNHFTHECFAKKCPTCHLSHYHDWRDCWAKQTNHKRQKVTHGEPREEGEWYSPQLGQQSTFVPFKQQQPAAPIKQQSFRQQQQPTVPVKQQQPAPPIKQQQPAPPIKQQQPAPPVKQQQPPPPIKQQQPAPPVKQQQPPAPIKQQQPPVPFKPQQPAPPVKQQQPPVSVKHASEEEDSLNDYELYCDSIFGESFFAEMFKD
jgi:hypothetical protein